MAAASNFKKYFSKKGLIDLFFKEIRYKSAKGIDNISTHSFEGRLSENLEIIYRKVNNGTYQFSQYREKLLSRGPDKNPRVISIPTIRDKLVQKALAEILKASFGAQMPSLHGIINDVICTFKSGHYDCFLKLDVKDFYPSIDHVGLINEVRKKIKKKEILYLIENAIKRKTISNPIRKDRAESLKGVPQGLSISNILANIYFLPIDKKYSSINSLKYFRYVDDILIFCNQEELDTIHANFTKDCANIGLELHKREENYSKTTSGRIADGFGYLGYEFIDNKISVRKRSIDKIHDSIIRVLTNYKYSKTKDITFLTWALNIRITGCIFNKSKYGWLFFFSQIEDLSLLGALDHFTQSQLNRFNLAIKPKTFLRTYHEMTQNLSKTTYIPNFDILPPTEKGKILKDVFKIKNPPQTPDKIEYEFNRMIYKMVTELEKDLGRMS